MMMEVRAVGPDPSRPVDKSRRNDRTCKVVLTILECSWHMCSGLWATCLERIPQLRHRRTFCFGALPVDLRADTFRYSFRVILFSSWAWPRALPSWHRMSTARPALRIWFNNRFSDVVNFSRHSREVVVLWIVRKKQASTLKWRLTVRFEVSRFEEPVSIMVLVISNDS